MYKSLCPVLLIFRTLILLRLFLLHFKILLITVVSAVEKVLFSGTDNGANTVKAAKLYRRRNWRNRRMRVRLSRMKMRTIRIQIKMCTAFHNNITLFILVCTIFYSRPTKSAIDKVKMAL